MRGPLVLAAILVSSCGMVAQTPARPTAPSITTIPALNGASIATLNTTTPNAKIYYTLDGSTPTPASQIYVAPFLVASNLTVKAIAALSPSSPSSVSTETFSPKIPPGTMVWSEEFTYPGAGRGQPNPRTWTYDMGNSGFGNNEQETYCAWGSNDPPCSASAPSAVIGIEGHLHILARHPSAGVYTSARLKSQGLFSFMYGRIEARIKVPESQGIWPAFWLLGSNITTVDWPACGELDVMEHIDGSDPQDKGYDWTQSSVHGKRLDGGKPYTTAGFSAADWHTYGMVWTKGQVQFYVDNPAHPYELFTPENTAGIWPFDQGPEFILLNLAIGGSWPGNVDSTTLFPSEMLVDYVRIYTPSATVAATTDLKAVVSRAELPATSSRR